MKSVVEEAIDSQARKLNNTIEKLTTDIALLKAENVTILVLSDSVF